MQSGLGFKFDSESESNHRSQDVTPASDCPPAARVIGESGGAGGGWPVKMCYGGHSVLMRWTGLDTAGDSETWEPSTT